ncbi:MAG: mitochondrial fission ELM1 family protein, partial [Campylobacterales bacterium]|nr:mitochondrial fission ELM1 family protein [Campylobacterales bacterium]
MKQILIISDGRKGHLNQSIALAKYLGCEYDIIEVNFKSKIYKILSYLFDMVGLYTSSIFKIGNGVLPRHPELVSGSKNEYSIVVSAGSSTYYAAKVIAKKFKAKTVAMMLPKGYRYDFDVIFAQTHDNPPIRSNIIEIPANFSFIKPLGFYKPKKRSVGIIIGGNNKIFTMSKETIKEQLDFIVAHFKNYEIAVTSSPRTPEDIEKLIESYGFDYEVIYSKNPINPIPDFLKSCETVFITSDSTSMISEAVSYGKANIVVLPLVSKNSNKF